jgi:hypothetical protein
MQISVASIETRGRQFYKVMGNAFSICNGSSIFSSREAVSPRKMIIWNKEPLMGFEMCL